MSKNNIALIVSVIIAIVGWVKYFQNNEQVTSAAAELSEQTKKSTEAEQQRLELKDIADGLQEELSRYKDAIAQNNSNKQALEAIVEKTKIDLETVSARTVEVESTVQNLRNELAAALERESRAGSSEAQKATELEARVEQLVEENLGLAESLAASYKDIETLNYSLSESGDKLNAVQDSFTILQSDHDNLKAELVSERSSRSSVSGELESQMDTLVASEKELDLAVAEQERLQKLLGEARSRAEKTEELEAKLNLIDSDVEAKSNALENSKAKVQGLEGELETLNRRRDELVQQLQAKESLVDDLNAKHKAAEEQLNTLRSEMATVTKSAELEIQNLKDSVTLIRMDSDIVFRPGSTRIRQGGQVVLDKVIEYAQSVPDRVISLEGHTDSVPISTDKRDRFPSNWELSAARAGSAVRYLQENGIAAERMRIAGYGEHRPVADNGTEEGRSANRRLEIVLSPAKLIEKRTTN
jgi:chemotaxis protein MotB